MDDTGYNLLLGFMAFWAFQIVVGIIVECAHMGYHRGNFRSHTRELFQGYLRHLEAPPRKRKSK